MLKRIRQIFALPSFEDDREKTSSARLLNGLALVVLAGTVIFFAANLIAGESMDVVVMAILGTLTVVAIGSLVALRLGYVRAVALVLCTVLWAGFTIPVFTFGGMRDMAITGYFAVIILAAVAGGPGLLVTFGLLSILSSIAVYAAEHAGLIIVTGQDGPPALNDLILLVLILASSAFILRYALGRITAASERERQGASALAESNQELQASQDALLAQTIETERRAHYLEATADVARRASSILDIRELLDQTSSLISQRFGFYHTGLFFLAPEGNWLVLQSASSTGGQRMLERGHRLRVGEGIVGTAVQQGAPRIALDVGDDAAFFDNPDLPGTRSEMALPLKARGAIIGVLDVQSTEPEAFSDDDIAVMQTLADQVALAISNSRLLSQAEAALAAERRAYSQLTFEEWQRTIREEANLGFLSDPSGTAPAGQLWEPQMATAVETGQVVRREGDSTEAAHLSIPITVRGQVIGVVDGRKPGGATGWTAAEIEMLESLTGQLELALDSARLYEETQRRAARDRMMGEVTSRMRQTLDIDTVLRTAAQEMHTLLNLAEVEVRVGTGPVSEPEMERETR